MQIHKASEFPLQMQNFACTEYNLLILGTSFPENRDNLITGRDNNFCFQKWDNSDYSGQMVTLPKQLLTSNQFETLSTANHTVIVGTIPEQTVVC